MNIKTWADRTPSMSECLTIEATMQAEIDALRAELAALKAQPAQEPVAYELIATKFATGKQLVYEVPKDLASYIAVKPLTYAATVAQPVQPAPLTDAEILSIIKNCPQESTSYVGWRSRQRLVWARAIEARVRTGGAG